MGSGLLTRIGTTLGREKTFPATLRKAMATDSNTLRNIRIEVCDTASAWMLTVAVPALALSLMRIPDIGWRPVMGLQIGAAVVLAAVVLFRSRIPLEIKAGAVVVLFLIVGVSAQVAFTLPGGLAHFASACAMATVFFGLRMGLAILGLSVFYLVANYSAVGHGFLSPPESALSQSTASILFIQIGTVLLTAPPPLIAISKYKWYLDLARLRAEADSAALNAENLIHQESERNLRESESKLQMALDASGTSLWDINPSTGQIMLDRRWSTMLGYPPQPTEMTFQELSRLVPPGERAAVMAKMAAALKGECELYAAEHRVRHRLGHWKWIESRGQVVERDANGRALRMIGTNTDITARKLEQQERGQLVESLNARGVKLVEAERLLRELTDGLPGAVYQLEWIEGGGPRFNFMSSGVWDLAALLPSQACANASNVFSRVFAGDRRRLWSLIRERGTQGLAWECEFRVKRPNGSLIWTRSVANISRVAGRTLWNGYWVDISSIKATEHELKEEKSAAEIATRAKSNFLTSMSHEIRTPLNGILANLELLATTNLDNDQSEMVADADKAGESLKAVIGNILDFTKIEAGKLTLELGELPVDALVSETVDILQSEARAKGIYIATWVGPDVPEVIIGDAARLRQILLNLLGNAVKFTARGGVLLVVRVIERDHDKWILEFGVHDSGRGFEQSDVPRLFEVFTQVRSASGSEEGTGLGLPICRSLVEALGGDLTATGALGEGATFRFTLPTLSLHAPRPVPPAILSDRKVLVVDAGASTSIWVSGYFAERRANIEHVATVADAANAALAAEAAGQKFDFAVIDERAIASTDPTELERLRQAHVLPILYAPIRTPGAWRKRARDGAVLLISDRPVPVWLDRNMVTMLRAISGRRPNPPGAAPRPASVHPELSGLRVLVLEDRALNQTVIARQLKKFDVTCVVVSDGLEGLVELERHTFDLVLADCLMPTMDGFAFAQAVRRFEKESGDGRRIPIIALTANAFREDADRCLAAGMDDFLSKPLTLDRLAATLGRWGASNRNAVGQARSANSLSKAESSSPPIDLDVLAELMGDGHPAQLTPLYLKFVSAARAACRETAVNADRADLSAVAAAAHGARGDALYFGARRLGELYATIEARAKANDAAAIEVTLAQVREEVARIEAFITAYTMRAA